MTTDPSPRLVGLLRGFVEAVVLGAIGAAAMWLTGADLGTWNVLVPAGLWAARAAEGWADERIDPTTDRGTLRRTLAGRSEPDHPDSLADDADDDETAAVRDLFPDGTPDLADAWAELFDDAS